VSTRLRAAIEGLHLRRTAPTLVAGAIAIVYVIVSPPSFDLAAHLFRAKLFETESGGIWNNLWYGGHHTPGYSVLFPAVSALVTPQLAAGLAATATAATFESLVHRRYGPDAWLGALWFGAAATAIDLYTGRLAFAFGLLPAMAAVLTLQRRRSDLAWLLSLATALTSPVAALFLALAGAAHALGRVISERSLAHAAPGIGVAAVALAPVALLSIAFPEGGSEPFSSATLWPIPLIVVGAFVFLPRGEPVLRVGLALYLGGCLLAYFVVTPVGSNAARLAPLFAGPLSALIWWPKHRLRVLIVALPLLYLQLQPPVRDVTRSAGDPSAAAGYYRPLLSFLSRQRAAPYRVEIPFTGFHWEAYEVASRYPLARGWERQLDIRDNHLFYAGVLSPGRYRRWLRELAVRFVAVSDASLDYSSRAETNLIDSGLPYLHLVRRSRHWRVYAVADPTPLAHGAASVQAIGADWVKLRVFRPGRVLLRVRFTPYWKLSPHAGCVMPAGDFTQLRLRKRGPIRLWIRFSFARIGSRAPRCS
jgi:hypothetical protein